MDDRHAALQHLDERGIAKEVHAHVHRHNPDEPRHHLDKFHHDDNGHTHVHVRHPAQHYDHHHVDEEEGMA